VTIPDDPWWRDFLASLPAHTAKVATVRSDGRPHVAPVWIALDGDDIVFTTGATTVKGRSLRHEPRVCISVDDERPPFSFVVIDGIATLSDDAGELRHWAAVISGRYMGEDKAEAYGRRNAVPGELVVRVTPTHVVAARNVAE
jgi:PPOX class probable F420-dependent enzyme